MLRYPENKSPYLVIMLEDYLYFLRAKVMEIRGHIGTKNVEC